MSEVNFLQSCREVREQLDRERMRLISGRGEFSDSNHRWPQRRAATRLPEPLRANQPQSMERTIAGFAGRSRWQGIYKNVHTINCLDVAEGARRPVRPVSPTWLLLPIPGRKGNQ